KRFCISAIAAFRTEPLLRNIKTLAPVTVHPQFQSADIGAWGGMRRTDDTPGNFFRQNFCRPAEGIVMETPEILLQPVPHDEKVRMPVIRRPEYHIRIDKHYLLLHFILHPPLITETQHLICYGRDLADWIF